jgi:hydroxymethylbilane synthase
MFEIVVIRTTGDARQGVPFADVGTKGMFVKEIEEALLAASIDLAVHSMKDMPAGITPGLAIAAAPKRQDPRDALVSQGQTLAELPSGAQVGTSSLRRKVLLRAARPDLQIMELRGNLDTRLRRLEEGAYDAIVVACAGMERLGWADRITERLSPEVSIPAPGQGALALETRAGDSRLAELLVPLHDADTWDTVRAERAFQEALGAGCTIPAGAYASLNGANLHLVAFLADEDGGNLRRTERRGPPAEAEQLGHAAAVELRA